MTITEIIPQLRTTNMDSTIEFYTEKLGFIVESNYKGFYVVVQTESGASIHLKLVDEDEKDPSIEYVDHGGHLHLYLQSDDVSTFAATLKEKGVTLVKDVHETAWGTRELVIRDDQGHTLYFGESL